MKRQEKLKLKEEKQLQKLNEKALVKKKSPSITTIFADVSFTKSLYFATATRISSSGL
jgi:hypothetical protein